MKQVIRKGLSAIMVDEVLDGPRATLACLRMLQSARRPAAEPVALASLSA